VTVRAFIQPGRKDTLLGLLAEMNPQGAAAGLVPFAELEGVHFARFFVLDDVQDLRGRPIPASLVYMAEVDAPLRRHLAELAGKAGPGLDRLFGHCTGYPTGSPGAAERTRWLRAHLLSADAMYVNTVGRGLEQIRQEARLREALEDFLDRHDWSSSTPEQIREQLQGYVNSRPDLAWARRPPRRPALGWRLRETAHGVALPLLGLPFAPLLLAVLPVWAVLLRVHELRDVPETERPTLEHIRQLAALEDHVVHNPFTVVGFLKPGRFREFTERAVLLLTNYAARHVFNKGSLAGVKTIHFARWVSLDGYRRVIFTSNYDGSLESYMDDFIDKIAWGLNATFSSGLGYPRTRWLLLDGAKDELTFKHLLRRRQIPTQVWYSAYDTLTARNIGTNARIRAGLYGRLKPKQVRDWLALL
jgi:hypothetical protein